MNQRKVIIDFNALVGKDPLTKKKYVLIKELTIVDVDTQISSHWHFDKPKNSQYSYFGDSTVDGANSWLASHYHGLKYESGFTCYDSLHQVLTYHSEGAKFLFAPTLEKAKVLEMLLNHRRVVFSLEMLGCPSLPQPTLFSEVLDEEEATQAEDLVDCCNSIVQLHERKDDTTGSTQTPPLVKNWQPCLFHHIYVPGFICSQANALRLADWCLNNISMLDMNVVSVREKTYGEWKMTCPSAKVLADAGFVRTSCTKDTTKCIYCGLVLYQWEDGDDALADHDYNSPYCVFVRFLKQKELREGESYANKDGRSKHIAEKGCQTERDDFNQRYGNVKDITEQDLVTVCKA